LAQGDQQQRHLVEHREEELSLNTLTLIFNRAGWWLLTGRIKIFLGESEFYSIKSVSPTKCPQLSSQKPEYFL
jgi:hypothetical protein